MPPTSPNAWPNGIDGATGRYLLDPLSPEQVVDVARSADASDSDTDMLVLRRKYERATRSDEALAVGDPKNLAEAGWGVIFAGDDPQSEEIHAALKPLIDIRRRQASAKDSTFFREYRGGDGVQLGETKQDFLTRHGVAAGMPADPAFMPYYLLIVGDPERISFRFQYELDVDYAVGRLWFPTVEEYGRYAKAVVEAEEGAANRGHRALLFAVRNPLDVATALSADRLVAPLHQVLRDSRPAWETTAVVGEDATAARLKAALADPPAVLFTASHGLYFPPDDRRHPHHVGALLCSDWPGPNTGPVERSYYVAADDVPADARPAGAVVFHFACFGAGTPAEDDYPHQRRLNRGRPLAARPFVAALPRALLAHRNGGCLAVIGHIERAWGCSFLGDKDRSQVQVFRAVLENLFDGWPVGLAMEWFNLRYASLATLLTGELAKLVHRQNLDQNDLFRTAFLWTGHHDARGYVVLGDPAVRLRATDAPPVGPTPLRP
jgi:hypothetical protein